MGRKIIKGILICMGFLLVSITLPLLIDNFVFGNSCPSFISNEAWAGFLGSYIGGLCTMIALFITIVDGNNKLEKQRQDQDNRETLERKLRIRPYLDTRYTRFGESVNMGPNDRFVKINGCKVASVLYAINDAQRDDIRTARNDESDSVACINYAIRNVGAGSAVEMIAKINGYEENLVIAKDETVHFLLFVREARMEKLDLEIQLEYEDAQGYGHYKKNDIFRLTKNEYDVFIVEFIKNKQFE